MIRLKSVITCDHCKKSEECSASVEGSIERGGAVEIRIDPTVTGWHHSYGADYCPACVDLLRLDRS